jgi:mono/diheme cytochrome c family protein
MARIPFALAVLLSGCAPGPDGDTDADTDGGDLVADTEAVDTEAADTDPPVDPLVRGAYLVGPVCGCADCHGPDLGGALVGDLRPDAPDKGELWAPNLTPDVTGLAAWTDAQVRDAIRLGHDPAGRPLNPWMPSWLYGHLVDADLDAVVAHLRALPPIDRAVPAPDVTLPVASPRVPVAAIPATTLSADDPDRAAADLGRYLGTLAGCLACHTPDDAPLYPIDTTRVLAGGRVFPDGSVTSNLTPDPTGLAGWTATDVATALTQGVDPAGHPLCAAMPTARLAGLTDDDALAIGLWLTTIPPIAHEVAPVCPE